MALTASRGATFLLDDIGRIVGYLGRDGAERDMAGAGVPPGTTPPPPTFFNPANVAITGGTFGGLSATSLTPGNSYMDLVVPALSTFVDNVLTVQNKSNNGASVGNAAFRFVDNIAAKERAAIGYSHVATGNPGGFIANLLYCEVGNLTAGDVDDTDWAVVVTHPAGTVNFPSTQLQAIRVKSATGGIDFRTQGSGVFSFQGPTTFTGDVTSVSGVFPPPKGVAGAVVESSLGMTTTMMRFRERTSADRAAWTTNVSNSSIQDNAALASWGIAFGAGGGDNFTVRRSAPGSGTLADLFAIGSTGRMTLYDNIQFNANGTVSIGATNSGASKLYMDYTNTGTVGAVGINKCAGRVNVAATDTSIVVTNNRVTAASKVFAVIATADASATIKNVVPAAGSFTITLGAAATAQTAIDFFVVNTD